MQNYSCASAGAVPMAVGAIATLYDFTTLAHKDENQLHALLPTVVTLPISSASGPTLKLKDVGGAFPLIGSHFFKADGTPTFDLFAKNNSLFCKKLASVNAPADASVGPAGTGAVPWLTLDDKAASVGLSEVYRVITAGGKAPASCADANLISVDYAAEYWFFGPATVTAAGTKGTDGEGDGQGDD